MKHIYFSKIINSSKIQDCQAASTMLFPLTPAHRIWLVLGLLLTSTGLLFSQNSLNSGDFSTGSWGSGQAMSASAGGSLIITKAVSSSGDKYFRFYGDGSPCGEYQPTTNGDFFTHDVVVTTPNADCGSANAWRVNVPTSSSNVVFKTDGGNDGMDRSIAFVVEGPVESVTSVTRAPAGNVYPGQDVVVTANLTADFSTGQAAWIRYTNDAFATSTVVKMTGSGTTRTANIPGATNAPSTAIAYYVFTSSDGSSISAADADFYTINLDNNGGSNYTYTTQAGWIANATGSWGTAGTWNAGVVPPTNANMGAVSIGTGVTLTLNQDAIVSSMTIATGKTFVGSDGSARTLTILSGGSLTKVTTGIFTATATGTVVYQGAGTFAATTATTFQNLQIAGALSGTGVSSTLMTINGSLQINTGGSISAAPLYATNSTLTYNTGSYNVGNEWTSAGIVSPFVATAGRPYNVTLIGTSNVTMPNSTRALFGDITIGAGTTLNLNATSGDLFVVRNWVNNGGTFNPSGRAVSFTGTSQSSTLTNAAGETFDYLIVSKTTSGNLILNNNVTVAANSGDVLQLTSATTNVGSIDLNGNSLTLSGTSGNISVGAGALIRNIIGTTGSLIISGGTKTVTRSATSTLVVAAGVNVQLSNGLNFNTFTTLNGTLTINTSGFVQTNPPIYGATSTLAYNTGAGFGVSTEWTSTLTAGVAASGRPNDVVVRNGTTLNMTTTNRGLARDLTIENGAVLNLDVTTGDLFLQRNWSNSGTFNHNNRAVGFYGTSIASTITNPAGETFAYLIVAKTTTGDLTLNNNVTVAGNSGDVLQLISATTNIGSINLNGNNLSITGTAGNISLGAGALVRNILGSGNLIISGGTKVVTRSATSTLFLAAGVNVQLSSGLNFGAGFTTLNGTLTINTGGSVVTNAPLYGLSSTLIYNQGGSVSVSTEWTSAVVTAVVTAGRPANVTIDNNTDLTASNVARAMFRNMTVSTGSLTLATGVTILHVGANWTRASGTTFTPNGRTVQFWAITATFLPTTITVPGGETFAALTLAKTAGIAVNLACDVTVTDLLTFTTGTLAIGSNTLTLNGTTTGATTTNGFSGTANSTLVIGGATTTFGTVAFITAAQTLGTLSISRTGVPSGTAAVTLGSNLSVNNGSGLNNSSMTLSNGVLQFTTGITLTVANTAIAGVSSTSFVSALLTGRLAFLVTGAGTYTLTYPLGSSAVTSPTAYRPLVVTSLVQSNTNTYSAASTAGGGATILNVYTAPVIAVSAVRYYPFTATTLANLTSIGSVSLEVGPDEIQTIDNLTIAQAHSGSWQNAGATGVTPKTTTGTINVSAATTNFALGFTKLAVVYLAPTGVDSRSGQNATDVPVGTGPKLTMNSAIAAVAEGGTIQTTAAGTFATAYTLNKNVNITSGVGAFTITGVGTVTTKAVFPFVPANVNTGTDAITLTAHQLATGMPVTYDNYGEASGFMPSDINTGTDVLTVGSNIATGQPVIYQAYPSAGAAGGLTHGTTYFAINQSATTIQLAATYADALAGTPVIDITSTGSALSHGVISSVIQGLTSGTLYYAIVVDANTIELASSNANALAGTQIDLVTTGGGNHVVYFTPTYSGTFAGAATMTISGSQSHIKGYFTLTNTNPTISLTAASYFMQPTITIAKTMTLNGLGIGSTTLNGGGKISSATSYFGINLSGIAAGTVTVSNLKLTGYYNGIDRNSATANVTTNITNVESSDNFSRGINFEGTGAISTSLNITDGIYSNNNGVGVNSHGIHISGMSKTGVSILRNTLTGNRTSAIEIGTGTVVRVIIRSNTISGANSATPLTNGVTEFGIGYNGNGVAPTGVNLASFISNNSISMYGRAGIECRGCVGNGSALTSGAGTTGALRIASNYITQAGGPFTSDPAAATPANEIRDVAGIAVGNISAAGNPSLMVIDTNHIVSIVQPNSITTAYTAFGIVVSGNSSIIRANIVTGCEIGIQAQQGASGNENNTPDNFYSRDATATSTGFLANRNSIFSNTDLGARNQGLTGTINFEGNWWGQEDGPTHAGNTAVAGYPAGSGDALASGTAIAYNGFMGKDPDDNVGTASGQRGIQATSGKNFRLKPTANATSLAAPYVINQGINVGFGNNNSTYPDTLDIYPATYTLPTESIKILRSMYLRGNFGSGTQPIIQGTGNSVHPIELSGTNGRMLINIASRNSGVENLNLKVNVPAFVFSPSMVMGIGDTILVATQPLAGVRIKNNVIENTGSYLFTSYGIYFRSVNQSSESHVFTITGNTVGSGTNFGAAVRIWGGRGEVSNNTLSGAYPFRWGTVTIGGGTSNIFGNTFAGSVELNSPQSGTTNVYKNVFNRNSSTAHAQGIELRLNRLVLGSIVNIDSNTFNNIGQGGYPYWGILSLRNTNINITRNMFNAGAAATDFAFIHASTRQQGTLANAGETFDNSLVVKGNTFTGNAAVSTNKVGISFARHRSSQTFGTVDIGGAGALANTFTGLSKYYELDPFTGNFSALGLPYSQLTGTPDSPIVPMDVNFDASQNVYEVAGGNKLPSAMTEAELFEMEDKVQHAIDYGSLGFVTIKPTEAFVTNTSFLSGYTATPAITRAVNEASDGWRITAETGTYNETVTVDKTLNFANDGTTVIQNLTMNGAGKTLTLEDDFEVSNAGTLTLTNGIIATGANTLRVTNTATGAVTGGGAGAHVNGNLNRAVVTGTNYDYMVGNGTDHEQLRMNFASQTGLTDATVSFTNTDPNSTSLTEFQEGTNYFNEVLASGYWIVTPNVGTTAATYDLRLWPINFTDYPTPKNSYTILKRVGAGNWHQNGTFEPADDLNPTGVWTNGSISRTGMTNFSNFGVGASIDVPLPIRLGSFLAMRKNEDVNLNWKTLSELNVKQTDVERSTDGSAFQTISTVSSRSEKGALYHHMDVRPFSSAVSTLYYRLKFIDYSGKVEYSEVRLVRDQFASAEVELYPNPVTDRLVFSSISNQSRITVIDQIGRKVISEQLPVNGGLDVSHLPPGIYQLLIRTDSETKSLSFVKK